MRHAGGHLHDDGICAGDAVLVDGERPPVGVQADPAQAYERLARDDQELLPLLVVPVVSLGDAGLGDVDRDLAPVRGAQDLGERSPPVSVGAQRVRERALFVVGEERGVELLGEGALGLVRDGEVRAGVAEGLQHRDYLPQRRAVGGPRVAQAVRAGLDVAQQQLEHARDEVVYVQELELDGGVAHVEPPAVGDGVAERRHGGVVPGAAPLAVEVGEPVDVHRGAGALGVLAEEPLSRQLRLSVGRSRVAPLERGLRRAGEHDGAAVAVMLEQPQELGGEAEVAPHEVRGVLGAVHAGEVEDEVRLRAVERELLAGAVDVVLVDREREQRLVALASVLAVADALQGLAEVPAHEPPGAGDEDLHYWTASPSRPSRASWTYSAVLIFSTVPATSRRRVLCEV